MKKADFVVIFIIIFISFVSILFGKFRILPNTREVVVKIAGQETYKIFKPGNLEIKNKQGKYITTLHYDGRLIWVTDSDCPDKICEKTGRVGPGGSIICVPNRMIIEFRSSQKNVDAQTW
ncbi:MAG: NusG domain II-containing protein [Fervidobacterium sp.]